MSLTLYKARRSRVAAHRRAAVLFETAVLALTLAGIGLAAGLAGRLFHL